MNVSRLVQCLVFKSKDHAFNRVERSSLVSFYQLFSNGNARYGLRHFHPSPLRHAKKLPSDANETLVEQQLLSYIQSGDDDDEKKDEKVTLPLVGVVLDVKNNIASISGLRNATIGSVVHITSDIDIVARGVVLFLERKITHVALFSEYSVYASEVQIGMDAKLVADELSISTSFDMLKGKVVDALGSPISLSHYEEESKESNQTPGKALEDISISWGSKSVPGFMQREQLKYPFRTGIHAIDLLKPLAYGHRFGILGPRNSGKTRLTLDIISRHVKLSLDAGIEPPHFVYVAVGKSFSRLQQIHQFLEETVALPYVTIVASSDRDSLIMQYLAPFTGCAIAEYFMKQSPSKSVVVYDDLATHLMIVENLVQTMKLPKASVLSLCAHSILMERSAQFVSNFAGFSEGSSLTTFALADAPDSREEPTEFKEKMCSSVDDYIGLESELALRRIYPPVDVLLPGSSIRGPPFQSAPLWKSIKKIRTRINESHKTNENVMLAKELGFEIEPDDQEVLEFRDILQQFFSQRPLQSLNPRQVEIGAFFLASMTVPRLPHNMLLWNFLDGAWQYLQQQKKELVAELQQQNHLKFWSSSLEESLLVALREFQRNLNQNK